MKKSNGIYTVFLLCFILYAGAKWGLPKFPISFFVLKGSGVEAEAYRLDYELGSNHWAVSTIPLTGEQQKEASELLGQRDIKRLEAFSRVLGKWRASIGIPGEEDSWPAYFGGGWDGLFREGGGNDFGDLGWGDKLYLTLNGEIPPAFPYAQASGSPPRTDKAEPVFSGPTPSPQALVRTGPLRVEIQNGCGITNAADWAARKFKGSGLSVSVAGNADNFHYPKTVVQTSAGVPLALEEAMDRLGIPRESAVETAGLPAGLDVRVVVGRDYLNLREKARERRHH
jgi:hypothetical protein